LALLHSKAAFEFQFRLAYGIKTGRVAQMGSKRGSYSHHAVSVRGIQFGVAQLRVGNEDRPSDCDTNRCISSVTHKLKNCASASLRLLGRLPTPTSGVRAIVEYLKRYRAPRDIRTYFATHQVKKLNVGCGPNILADWLNVDVQPQPGAVYLVGRKPGHTCQTPLQVFSPSM
jgi:hypothetical protein